MTSSSLFYEKKLKEKSTSIRLGHFLLKGKHHLFTFRVKLHKEHLFFSLLMLWWTTQLDMKCWPISVFLSLQKNLFDLFSGVFAMAKPIEDNIIQWIRRGKIQVFLAFLICTIQRVSHSFYMEGNFMTCRLEIPWSELQLCSSRVATADLTRLVVLLLCFLPWNHWASCTLTTTRQNK